MNRMLIVLSLLMFGAAGCSDRPVDQHPTDAGANTAADAASMNCSPGRLSCHNPTDQPTTCTCTWSCDPKTGVCSIQRPAPNGGDWSCSWIAESSYSCTGKGQKSTPPGSSQWYCSWQDSQAAWKCSWIKPAVPPTKGPWKCIVNNSKKWLTCEPVPGAESITWICTNQGGRKLCQKKGENGGLPVGGSGWKCHQTTKNGVTTWVCYGQTTPGDAAPGKYGWSCQQLKLEPQHRLWRCERASGSKDTPPGGGSWACAMGTAYAGTQCEKSDPAGMWPSNKKCVPGTRMWCDGLNYGSWGQAQCLPTGEWPTKMINGKKVLDCQSLSDGRRPDTVCSCYHFFFNPSCCERGDCIVPPGSKGQICKPSAGQLCDHCNPMKPECTATGAKCVVTNSHETFCAALCAKASDCPAGYKCMQVKLKLGSTMQCIPSDYSCYY